MDLKKVVKHIKENEISEIKQILKESPEITTQEYKGKKLILIAFLKKKYDIVDILYQYGATLEQHTELLCNDTNMGCDDFYGLLYLMKHGGNIEICTVKFLQMIDKTAKSLGICGCQYTCTTPIHVIDRNIKKYKYAFQILLIIMKYNKKIAQEIQKNIGYMIESHQYDKVKYYIRYGYKLSCRDVDTILISSLFTKKNRFLQLVKTHSCCIDFGNIFSVSNVGNAEPSRVIYVFKKIIKKYNVLDYFIQKDGILHYYEKQIDSNKLFIEEHSHVFDDDNEDEDEDEDSEMGYDEYDKKEIKSIIYSFEEWNDNYELFIKIFKRKGYISNRWENPII